MSDHNECASCQQFKAPAPDTIKVGDLLTLFDDEQLPTWYGLVTLISKSQTSSRQHYNYEISMLASNNTVPMGLFQLSNKKQIFETDDLNAIASITKWNDCEPSNNHPGWTSMFPRLDCILATSFISGESLRSGTLMVPSDGLPFVLIAVRHIDTNTNTLTFRRLRRETGWCSCKLFEEPKDEYVDLNKLLERTNGKILYEVPALKIGVLLMDKIWWSIDESSLQRIKLPNDTSMAPLATLDNISSTSATSAVIVLTTPSIPTPSIPTATPATPATPATSSLIPFYPSVSEENEQQRQQRQQQQLQQLQRQHQRKRKLPTSNTRKVPCTICLGTYDLDNLITCFSCRSALHWYCDASPYVASVTEDQRWLCRSCQEERAGTRTTTAKQVVDIRTKCGSDDLEYLNKGHGWQTSGIPTSELITRMARRQKQLANGIQVIPVALKNARQGWHEMHVKSNNTRLGLRQLTGCFNNTELDQLEKELLHLIQRAQKGELSGNTVDASPRLSRTKIFLGYRYSYGPTKAAKDAPRLFNDVDAIQDHPWIHTLATRLAKTVDFPYEEFNQVVLNCYHTRTALLHLHKDETRLFEYPVVSLRLFSPRFLSFGYKGQGMVPQPCSWKVRQTRGQITVMEGLSATHFKHCIRSEPDDGSKGDGMSVSLIFRRVKLASLASPSFSSSSSLPPVLLSSSSSASSASSSSSSSSLSSSPSPLSSSSSSSLQTFNFRQPKKLLKLGGKIIDPTELSKVVSKLGGYAFVKQNRKWQNVRKALSLPEMSSSGSQINKAYNAYFSISSVAPPPVHKKQRVSSSSSSSSSSNSSSSNSNHSSSNRSSSSINHSSSNSNSSSINNSNNINNIRVQRNSTDRHENSFSVDEVVQVFWQDPYSSKEWWKARLRGRRRKGLHEIQFMVFFEVDSSWDWVAANRVRKIQ